MKTKGNDWEEYIQEILFEIKKIEGSAIVEVSGCYYKSDYRKCKENNTLRVYINGGFALGIPLKSKVFKFVGKAYLKTPYMDENTIKRIREIEKDISDNPYIFKENEFELLKEYFAHIKRATDVKFGKYLTGELGSSKERKYQILLYKKMIETPREDLCFFDIEFQTIAEMQYSIEYVRRWKNHKKNISDLHTGKPDFIAFDKNGFIIIELKTNKESSYGNAGLGDHNKDFKSIIQINKENHVFVTELLRRLKVMYDYNLINEKWESIAENLMNIPKEEIDIKIKYLFITNLDFTKDKCEKTIQDYGLKDNEYIIEKVQ